MQRELVHPGPGPDTPPTRHSHLTHKAIMMETRTILLLMMMMMMMMTMTMIMR